MTTAGDRGLARLLRVLARGAARCEAAAVPERMILVPADGVGHAFEAGVVRAAVRRGLVTTAEGRLAISAAGRALLARQAGGSEPFAAQHQEREPVAMPDGAGRPAHIVVNRNESPLSALARRKGRDGEPFLSAQEFEAGERLRADYTRGQLLARTGIDWNSAGAGASRPSYGNGIAELTDAALAARQRVERAIGGVGPELAGVLIDVCCFLKGLEQVEMERCWPVRSAKVVLKQALAALARHYRPDCAGARRPPMLHWGAEGYRPTIRT